MSKYAVRIMDLKISAVLLPLLFLYNCTSYVDIRPPAKGSPENPVLCDGPVGERIYLDRLRGLKGKKIRYKYDDAVMGAEGRILDRFLLSNPASSHTVAEDKKTKGVMEALSESLSEEPDTPTYYRVYMDMYHPGVIDDEPIPGFYLEPFK